VGTVAPKDGVKDAKASQKDNSQDSNDKPDDKSAADAGAQQDTNTTQASQPAVKSPAPAKTGKSDTDKKEAAIEADEEASEESQIAATTLQLLSLQNVPQPPTQPTVQAPVVAPVAPSIDTSGDLTVDAAAPAAQTTPSAPLHPGASAADAPAGAPQPVADDQQDDETAVATGSQTQISAPQSQVAQPDIKPAQPGKPVAKPQTIAAKPASDPAPQPAGDDTVTQEDLAAAAADTPKANTAAKPATGKNDTIKAAPVKADKTDIAKGRFDAKTDTNKGDADKITQLAAAAPQAEADKISEAPAAKPALQPVQALDNNSLINPNTPVGPANPAAAAHVTQHIQVTATPAPNLPALAVEIAAKSQSGSKQFDIRLDPPELGRVEVRLSIDATGKASAHLSADQPQTLHLLQKDAPALTRALREAGLDVSQDGLNFSLRQQSDNNQSAGNSNRRSRSFSLSATTGIDATAMTAAYRAPANGRLDIRV